MAAVNSIDGWGEIEFAALFFDSLSLSSLCGKHKNERNRTRAYNTDLDPQPASCFLLKITTRELLNGYLLLELLDEIQWLRFEVWIFSHFQET